MARRSAYYPPTGDRPTESEVRHDDAAPHPTMGMVPCPNECGAHFHFRGSVAYTRHQCPRGAR